MNGRTDEQTITRLVGITRKVKADIIGVTTQSPDLCDIKVIE